MKNVFIGQAFMLPSYVLIGLAIAAAPNMDSFLAFMGWAVVAMITGGIAGIIWVRRVTA